MSSQLRARTHTRASGAQRRGSRSCTASSPPDVVFPGLFNSTFQASSLTSFPPGHNLLLDLCLRLEGPESEAGLLSSWHLSNVDWGWPVSPCVNAVGSSLRVKPLGPHSPPQRGYFGGVSCVFGLMSGAAKSEALWRGTRVDAGMRVHVYWRRMCVQEQMVCDWKLASSASSIRPAVFT